MKNCTRHRASEWFIPFLTSTAFVEGRKLYEVAMGKVPAIVRTCLQSRDSCMSNL